MGRLHFLTAWWPFDMAAGFQEGVFQAGKVEALKAWSPKLHRVTSAAFSWSNRAIGWLRFKGRRSILPFLVGSVKVTVQECTWDERYCQSHPWIMVNHKILCSFSSAYSFSSDVECSLSTLSRASVYSPLPQHQVHIYI